jgi:hypothetical protein
MQTGMCSAALLFCVMRLVAARTRNPQPVGIFKVRMNIAIQQQSVCYLLSAAVAVITKGLPAIEIKMGLWFRLQVSPYPTAPLLNCDFACACHCALLYGGATVTGIDDADNPDGSAFEGSITAAASPRRDSNDGAFVLKAPGTCCCAVPILWRGNVGNLGRPCAGWVVSSACAA